MFFNFAAAQLSNAPFRLQIASDLNFSFLSSPIYIIALFRKKLHNKIVKPMDAISKIAVSYFHTGFITYLSSLTDFLNEGIINKPEKVLISLISKK